MSVAEREAALVEVTVEMAQRYAEELVGKASQPRSLLLRALPVWSGPEVLRVGGPEPETVTSVRVCPCVSALAVREALADTPDGEYLIVLTARLPEDLGEGLLVHFRDQSIRPVDQWDPIRAMFRARRIDPDVRRQGPWLAASLLANTPFRGWQPAPAGALTIDHVFAQLLRAVLDLDDGEPGAGDLDPALFLEGSRDLTRRGTWQALEPKVRRELSSWVQRKFGLASGLALQIAASPRALDPVSVGLVTDVLWPGEGEPPRQALVARGRLEGVLGGLALDDDGARELAAAARRTVLRLAIVDPPAAASRLAGAEALLGDVQWAEGATGSDVLPAGLTHRLRALGAGVNTFLAKPGAIDVVEDRFVTVLAHQSATIDPRTRTARMAVRLTRWLAQPEPAQPVTLLAAVQRQVHLDAWVDRAASEVWGGSADPEIGHAYGELYRAVRARRRTHDEQFARLLADATERGLLTDGLIPVEAALTTLVRPLAEHHPVLLIVIDGMSTAVATQVADDLAAQHWLEVVPTAGLQRIGVLAALPTLTKHSRTSLLTGTLQTGTQYDEKQRFPALGGGAVFHKDGLRAEAGRQLPADLSDALASAAPVVGVVLNTIDDALAKHDPGGTDWGAASIQHLAALLDAAHLTGRVVILTSDHGHVVERGSAHHPHDGAEARFRPAASEVLVGDGEVVLQGERVLIPGGIVAAWDEEIRYGGRQAGYHGGASAAEVVIPFLVLTTNPDQLSRAGWAPAPPQSPIWWDDAVPTSAVRPVPPARKPSRRVVTPGDTTPLFDALPAQHTQTSPASPTVATPSLVSRLLSSDTYLAQRARAQRQSLDDAVVSAVLTALIAHNGRAHRNTLATAAGLSLLRFGPAWAALRRLLNVEGYEVLALDPDGQTAILDQALLREQFGLGDTS